MNRNGVRQEVDTNNGKDRYKVHLQAWKDEVELWPSVTHTWQLDFSSEPLQWERPRELQSLEGYRRTVAGDVGDIIALLVT